MDSIEHHTVSANATIELLCSVNSPFKAEVTLTRKSTISSLTEFTVVNKYGLQIRDKRYKSNVSNKGMGLSLHIINAEITDGGLYMCTLIQNVNTSKVLATYDISVIDSDKNPHSMEAGLLYFTYKEIIVSTVVSLIVIIIIIVVSCAVARIRAGKKPLTEDGEYNAAAVRYYEEIPQTDSIKIETQIKEDVKVESSDKNSSGSQSYTEIPSDIQTENCDETRVPINITQDKEAQYSYLTKESRSSMTPLPPVYIKLNEKYKSTQIKEI